MTRQMADDEVLRPEVVAWAVTKGERLHLYPGANDPREVHDNGGQHDPLITLASHNAAVAALQAERDALERNLVAAMAQVAEADKEAERAESALEALRGQVAGLVADAYAAGWVVCAQWARREDLVHDIGSGAYAEERDAALLAIKERMG